MMRMRISGSVSSRRSAAGAPGDRRQPGEQFPLLHGEAVQGVVAAHRIEAPLAEAVADLIRQGVFGDPEPFGGDGLQAPGEIRDDAVEVDAKNEVTGCRLGHEWCTATGWKRTKARAAMPRASSSGGASSGNVEEHAEVLRPLLAVELDEPLPAGFIVDELGADPDGLTTNFQERLGRAAADSGTSWRWGSSARPRCCRPARSRSASRPAGRSAGRSW